MASKLLCRFSRRSISAAARPIGLSPAHPAAFSRSNSPSSVESKVTSVEAAKFLRQSFIANPTLQRFGYSSSTLPCQPGIGDNQTSAQKGLRSGEISKLNYQKFSSPHAGIEEIVLDYVHHEVTQNMVMLYLRLFLIIVTKDVFISCYDLLAPQ